MGVRAAAAILGVLFGFLISWGQFTDPDRIRDMLLLEDPYIYLMMASAIAVGFGGLRLLRRLRARALVTGEEISYETARPEPRHYIGAATFGLGWAVACTCPGPVAAQIGQGVAWSAFTVVGIVVGVLLYLRREERPAASAAARPEARGAPRRAAA